MDQPVTDRAELDRFLGLAALPPRARLLKWGGFALILLLVGFLVVRYFLGRTAAVDYATQPAARGSLEVTVSATGNLAPTTQVNVGVEQSGTVEAVYVNNNDRVGKGQVLARLDLSKLRDALAQANANLAQAVAATAQARAVAVQDKLTLDRYLDVARLSGGKVPSATELDVARGTYARDAANLQAAQAAVKAARAAVLTAQTNVSKGVIVAPVNGVVLSRQVQPGQTVAASFNTPTLFTIAEDLSRMKLEVKVDEADIGDVRPGERARFTVDAYPDRLFPAQVTRVDVGANATPQINSAGSVVSSSTSNVIAYTAVLSVDNRDFTLKPGMTATAEIITAEDKGILLVPNAALRFRPDAASDATGSQGLTSAMVPRMPARRATAEGGKAVTVGRGSARTLYVLGGDGQPKAVAVIVGRSNGSLTEILGGQLASGDKVITGKLVAGSTGRT